MRGANSPTLPEKQHQRQPDAEARMNPQPQCDNPRCKAVGKMTIVN